MSTKYGGETAFDKLIQLVKSALGMKVDKIEGKGLSTNDYTTTEKNKLGGIEAGAQVNTVNSVNGQTGDVSITVPEVPSAVSAFTNDAGYQTDTQVQTAIRSAIGGVYVPQGTVAFAQLPSPAADKLGYVYNVSDAFTTTGSFVEGSGKSYGAGANVACVLHGGIYLWDVLGGTFDIDEITAAEVQTLWDSN